MTSSEIRQSFLEFFRSKEHSIVPSSSLLPDSPNLLFTNAGMNQFVPIFLGETACPYQPGRAADTQKCIRAGGKHNDLEDVGLDTYHHTFFEMLGNWSFGNYFKKEAISWAWELIVGTWKFPANRVYATVYKPGPGDPASFDQEAYDYWKEIFTAAGLDPDVHIVYGNKKDNFWMMGDTGPCGPCSELHIDLTPEDRTPELEQRGAGLVNSSDARCIEIWNLVFIQFNANPDGSFSPLPAQHVDTGMGFERVASIIQGTKNFTDFKNARISNYETDIFRPIFDEIEKLTGKTYGSTLPEAGSQLSTLTSQIADDVAFRVIADHIRTLSFSIADGIQPSNEGRGYVLRRILRRAVRYGRELGLHELFFYKLSAVLARTMGDIFPEIRSNLAQVEKVIRAEEESFSKTLDRGLQLFREACKRTTQKSVPSVTVPAMVQMVPTICGEDAFLLYDTYGFPLDLTQLLARERGMHVDDDRYNELMLEQRERSKASQKKEIITLADQGKGAVKSEFVGFEQKTSVPIEVFTFSIDLPEKESEAEGFVRARLYFSPTPFYGEMGGQVGDTGYLEFGGKKIEVLDTQRGGPGVVVHLTEDIELLDEISLPITASVDETRRGLIEGHHSVTHIMHWALRKVLGDTVRQKGSYVGPDRLRFDFAHLEAAKPEELETIERLVNERIAEAAPVTWTERPYAEVKGDSTVLQFFGDKYGETVRVVDIGGYSKELCGGTHVRNTKDIGTFRLLSESAIAAGVRRIEAVTGEALREYILQEFAKQEQRLTELKQKHHLTVSLIGIDSRSPVEDLWNIKLERQQQLAGIEAELREKEKAAGKEKQAELQKTAAAKVPEWIAKATEVNGTKLILENLGEIDPAFLQLAAGELKKSFKGVAVLAGSNGGKAALLALVTEGNANAGQIIKQIAPLVGGKGGGKPDLAQGGGTDPFRLDEALAQAKSLF